jgi:UDP-N-acetylglucosamine 2-epimerase (non-hydrolysing)
MIQLLNSADLVLTDSGGLQEECPALGIPVLVLRRTTERPESVERGTARVIGTKTMRIFEESSRALAHPTRRNVDLWASAHGDGRAAARIAAALLNEPFDQFDAGRRAADHNRVARLGLRAGRRRLRQFYPQAPR